MQKCKGFPPASILSGAISRNFVETSASVFGIGLTNRPESPSPSGVAQGFSLIPVDSAEEVAGVVCEVEGEETQEAMESKEHPTTTWPMKEWFLTRLPKTHHTLSHAKCAWVKCDTCKEKKCTCVRPVRYCLYTPRQVHDSCHCLDEKLPQKNFNTTNRGSVYNDND